MPKLPRKVEADPRHEALEKLLTQNLKPLWEKSPVQVPTLPFHSTLEDSLLKVLGYHQLERGLENIEQILNNEENGLAAIRKKAGTAVANRVSRLVIIANDGTERFYRSCESILLRHSTRVLCLRVDVPCARLAQNLFGPEKVVKALLVSEKEAVSNVLFSLIQN